MSVGVLSSEHPSAVSPARHSEAFSDPLCGCPTLPTPFRGEFLIRCIFPQSHQARLGAESLPFVSWDGALKCSRPCAFPQPHSIGLAFCRGLSPPSAHAGSRLWWGRVAWGLTESTGRPQWASWELRRWGVPAACERASSQSLQRA